MVGTNKNFRRKLKAPARNDQEDFMAIKTHLALPSSFDHDNLPGGVTQVRKKREISFSRFPSFSLLLPFCVSDIWFS